MIERQKVILNLCRLLETEYVALLGQRGIGVKSLIHSLETQKLPKTNMKFISIALPRGMQSNEEFMDIFIERLIEKADKVPPENTLVDAIEEILEKFPNRSADFRLRKALSILGKKTTATYLVIVLHALAEAPEAPLKNLLHMLRDYHNQREDLGTVGEKLRFLAAGGERLWKLCCHKTVDISPFNIAHRVFLDGCSCEELQSLEIIENFEAASNLRCLTDGIPTLVEQVLEGSANFENLLPFFGFVQNHWNSLPAKSQENLKKLVENTVSFPSCFPDFNCPQVPDITSPWMEAFWGGFLRMSNDKLTWRSTIHREFVINKTNSQSTITENFIKLQPVMLQEPHIYILHLSDIHLGTNNEAKKYRTQLEIDLKQELKVKRLQYLVISGDIANCSTEAEYEAACELVDGLMKRFSLSPSQVIIVPGNHDLNWELAKKAYTLKERADCEKHELQEGSYIEISQDVVRVREQEKYKQRFAFFNDHFYKKITAIPYPLEYAEQGILYPCPAHQILFLGLNSCWEIDQYHKGRASINSGAISHTLDKIADGEYEDWLKIAVWHHPVIGSEMMNDEFLQLLSVGGFQVGMHGHIHEAKEAFYKYDTRRGIHIVGAGTFGIPTHEQVTSVPLQYNLLIINSETGVLTVETRKKEKPDGAWSADARWGDKNNPVPRYTIQLQYGAGSKTGHFSNEPKVPIQENRPYPLQNILSNVQAGGHITVGNITQIYGSGTVSPSENPPPKRTILMLASSPINQAKLRLDKEAREIDLGLQRAQKREQFTLEQKWAVRPDDLRRALLDFNPQIVHFCGHGAGDDGLVLENNAEQAQLVPTTALANLFKLFASRGMECVVMNACYSKVQAEAIAQHINYVIGMSDAVGDNAAIKFAVGFYDALGAGWSYEDAYFMGCNAIALEGIPEELTPVLKKKIN